MNVTNNPTIESNQEDFDPESMLMDPAVPAEVIAPSNGLIILNVKNSDLTTPAKKTSFKVNIQDLTCKMTRNQIPKYKLVVDIDYEVAKELFQFNEISIREIRLSDGKTIFYSKDFFAGKVRKMKTDIVTLGVLHSRVQFKF
jgi:hypothetical protein